MDFELFDDPNKHARKAGIDEIEEGLSVHGYQEFTITESSLTLDQIDAYQIKKQEALKSVFLRKHMFKRSVLDLGGNSGFYSLWALNQGASSACVNDIDDEYLRVVQVIKDRFNIPKLSTNNQNILDIKIKGDIVIALALIHWIYSCTATLGSLPDAIRHLANLCNYMLIIEWIDPADQAISFFHHLDWNQSAITGPYNQEEFEKALTLHFPRWERVSGITETRSIYVAYKTHNEIDLSFPLPLLENENLLISSRKLTQYGGIDYWSLVYDLGETILKETTGNLAYREGLILDSISEPNDNLPKVLIKEKLGSYSRIELTKLTGIPFSELTSDAVKQCNGKRILESALSCLRVLERAGILHRDIRPANLLLDGNSVRLVDFGWAVSKTLPQYSPPGLGETYRPSDGSFSDSYSMARTLLSSRIEFDNKDMMILRYMSMEDPEFRNHELVEIQRLLRVDETD